MPKPTKGSKPGRMQLPLPGWRRCGTTVVLGPPTAGLPARRELAIVCPGGGDVPKRCIKSRVTYTPQGFRPRTICADRGALPERWVQLC